MASSADFEAAAEASRKLLAKPSDDELLSLYALFKQGKQDPPFEKAPSPGMFDLKGKYKYGKWKEIVEEGVTPEQAQERYIALVEKLKAKYGYDESKAPEAVGS
ncbi:Acyl CoA binding protein family [Arthroderma uncinatum]|uniref:Acyl CoA binding protein family n=1 Tax=Arthroderma uncinatum TaxID=74035 RepID=UPI00144A6283|nr:Acyl CoA binding protein family [Arthroderma uncinatum]KAF3482939.1 Acyl CoA binding protein family [Arthroderma uncinatum]